MPLNNLKSIKINLGNKIKIGIVYFSSSPSSASAAINYPWSNVFSPENKIKTIKNLKYSTELIKKQDVNNRMILSEDLYQSMAKSAVLVPLCLDNSLNPSLLFTIRSMNLAYPGQVSFPGGKLDDADKGDVIVGALRESEEELGLQKDQIDVWCQLFPMTTKDPRLCVIPVLAVLKNPIIDINSLNINPDEVSKAFCVPLSHFCNEDNWAEVKIENLRMPSFINLQKYQLIDEKKSEEEIPIWGLTGIITHLILLNLIPEIYQRNIYKIFDNLLYCEYS